MRIVRVHKVPSLLTEDKASRLDLLEHHDDLSADLLKDLLMSKGGWDKNSPSYKARYEYLHLVHEGFLFKADLFGVS